MCALCFVYITHEGAQKQMQPVVASVWAWASFGWAIHGTLLTTSALDDQILEGEGGKAGSQTQPFPAGFALRD